MKKLTHEDMFISKINDLERLAIWLKVLPRKQVGMTDREWRSRIIFSIQKEEKRLSRAPK